jgi:hypothetical protein
MAEEVRTKLGAAGRKRKRAGKGKVACLENKKGCSACEVGGESVLRHAACFAVKERRDEIAESMVDKAIKGDANVAKLLLALMNPEGGVAVEKKKRRGRSTAQELAAEAEWQEPVDGPFAGLEDEEQGPRY